MNKDPFKDYLKETEPDKREKGYAWHTAIGLQAVDGLEPSRYLVDTAIKNIEGDITMDEAGELLHRYYEENPKIILRYLYQGYGRFTYLEVKKRTLDLKKRTLSHKKRTLKVCFRRMKVYKAGRRRISWIYTGHVVEIKSLDAA